MTNKEIKAALLTPGTQFTVNRTILSMHTPVVFEMNRFAMARPKAAEGCGLSVSNTSKTFSTANVDKITASAITFYTYSPFFTLTKDRIKFSEIEIVRVGKEDQ